MAIIAAGAPPDCAAALRFDENILCRLVKGNRKGMLAVPRPLYPAHRRRIPRTCGIKNLLVGGVYPHPCRNAAHTHD